MFVPKQEYVYILQIRDNLIKFELVVTFFFT